MAGATPQAPAGWYPDPENAGQVRFWDGNAWTPHRQSADGALPVAQPTPTAPQTPQPSNRALLGWGIPAGLVVILVIIGIVNGAGGNSRPGDTEDPIEQARVVLEANHDEQYTYSEIKSVTDRALSVTGEPLTDRNRSGAWSAALAVTEGSTVSPMAVMRCTAEEGAGSQGAGLSLSDVIALCSTILR